MEVVVERCAGIDVHKDMVAVCVRVPGPGGERVVELAEFSTFTEDLLALRDWLVAHGVTRVGMEATGVYWKPIFWVLEEAVECWLLNARHMRNVPGRKTDMADAEWICRLMEHGLVRASFVPPPEIRELRDLTRFRKTRIEERTREAQRLDKILQDAGVKLSSVASDVLGRSGRDMLEALVAGSHDPAVLAELARGQLRRKLPQLQAALEGRFSSHHALLVSEVLSLLDYLDESIGRLSVEIDRVIAPFAEHRDRLASAPGIDKRMAEAIIGEIGVDMTRFPTAAHLASWAGMCPGQHESAGKARHGTARHGNSWLQRHLTMAALSASRTKNTYLAAQYQAHRGTARQAPGSQSRRPQPPDRCLAHPGRRRRMGRSRCRLLRPPPNPRTPRTPQTRRVTIPRLDRHHQPRRHHTPHTASCCMTSETPCRGCAPTPWRCER